MLLIGLVLAGLTGLFVWKKYWGWAVFCGLMFLYFLWASLLLAISIWLRFPRV